MKKILLQNRAFRTLSSIPGKCAALYQKAKKGLFSLGTSISVAIMMNMPAFAATGDSNGTAKPGQGSDIWQWLDYALNNIYLKFLGVSTIAACVAASICLIMMNFSTDDRTVATSRAWLKRILLSWIILNVLGFVMVYLVDLTDGGVYVPSGNSANG